MMKKVISLALSFAIVLSCAACSSASQTPVSKDPFVTIFAKQTQQQFETFQPESDDPDELAFYTLRKDDAKVEILCNYKGEAELKNIDSIFVYVAKSLGEEALKSQFRTALEILNIPEAEIKKALENDSDFSEEVTSPLNGLNYLVFYKITEDRYKDNNFSISVRAE